MWVKYFLSINYFYTNDGILEHIGKKSAILKKNYVIGIFSLTFLWLIVCGLISLFKGFSQNEMNFKIILQKICLLI